MADTATSGLPLVTSVLDAQEVPVNDAGTSRKANWRQVARYIGDALHNESFAAAQSLPASSTTYITGSAITIPTGERVTAGTWFRWNYHLTKTAAGTVANSVLVKFGINGTTADATILTLTLPVGTAVADEAEVEIVVGFRSVGAGTAAVATGRARLIHNLAATGWATIPNVVTAVVASSGFNSDVNLSKIGIAMTIGASYVVTCSLVRVEAKNL